MLSQGEERDVALNSDTYRNLQKKGKDILFCQTKNRNDIDIVGMGCRNSGWRNSGVRNSGLYLSVQVGCQASNKLLIGYTSIRPTS